MKKLLLVLVALTFVGAVFGQSGTTKRVAILETVDKEGKVSYGVKLMVRSKLSAVITATPGYEGYDRVDVGSILGEHEFQRTGLVSDKDIKRLGEMTGANYILVAEVAYLNDSYIFLSAKILDVETARVEQTADIQAQTTVEALEQSCKVLAGKLLNVNVETGAVKGELMLDDGHRYIGEHKNGTPHGKGIIFYNDTIFKSYEGDWVYGKFEGKGILIWQDGTRYIGDWKNSKQEGYGVGYSSTGMIYEGNWLNSEYHGKGKMTFASNDAYNRKYYDGDWVNGVRQGTGTMVWNDGGKYVGGWKNGCRYGKGVMYDLDGNRYEGDWVDDKKHGQGVLFFPTGNKWEGYWEKGMLHGSYTFYFSNGDRRVGTYVNGVEDGPATYYFSDGRYCKEYWVGGKHHGTEEYYTKNGYKYQTKIYQHGVLKKTKKH